jgi:hypothetical protein
VGTTAAPAGRPRQLFRELYRTLAVAPAVLGLAMVGVCGGLYRICAAGGGGVVAGAACVICATACHGRFEERYRQRVFTQLLSTAESSMHGRGAAI